ncbi:uncharacterized protein LOC143597844 [Bidens hawaiensis]|uniref:uncharacterized protein LOC143597844 n=1 Tax=Bidens hawaiensis TaxID=980011 RepID=UPI00404A2CE5
MAGARQVVGAVNRTGRHGRPRMVRQPFVESASNTREEGSTAGQNPSNNEEHQLDPAVQAAIVQAVAATVKNLTPEGSARSHGRTVKGLGGDGKKDEREKGDSSEVRFVKTVDGKEGRGGCNHKSFKGYDPSKLTGLGDTIATLQ